MSAPKISKGSHLFGSARSTGDLALAAFAGALLLAVAAGGGAFLPRFSPGPENRPARAEPAPVRPAPVMASEPCAAPPRG